MKYSFTVLGLICLIPTTIVRADALSDLANFSVFSKIDIDQLAKGEPRTMAGPPMSGRFLSVQSCYVVPGPPANHIQALGQWNPARHAELKVFLHADLPASSAPANFSKLSSVPDNSSIRAFVADTQKLSSDLQISKEEAAKFSGGADRAGGKVPENVVKFWSEVLAARAKYFVAGGTAPQAPYDHAPPVIRPNDEFNSLLRQQDKIRNQFAGFIGQTGIGRGAGSLKPDLYWEVVDVDGHGVVTLGASYSKAGAEGAYQAADALYFASGGYYVALTLYQMWPVTADGKPSTLVWRGDLISSASLASLHGVERVGSESATRKKISRAINLFRKDTAR